MRITGAIIAAVAAAALFPASAAAQSDAGINFFAEPAGSSPSGFFHVSASSGDSIEQRLALRNDSDERLTLHLYPTDSSTAVQGGADYGTPEDEPTAVGTWIVLERDVVRLRPDQSAYVSFRVRVPEDAPTGENLGGIAIYPEDDAETQDVEVEGNEAGAQVIVEYRRVIAVQVDLPGNSEPRLVISGIRPTARPSGAFLDMDIANEGNGLTKGVGILRVPEFDFEEKFLLDTFVPRSQIFYPMAFRNKISNGEYEASIRIEYDEGNKVAEWAGTFVIEPELQEQLAERGAPGAVVPSSRRGNLVPVAIAVGVLGLILFAFRRRRERRRALEPVPVTTVGEVEPEPVVVRTPASPPIVRQVEAAQAPEAPVEAQVEAPVEAAASRSVAVASTVEVESKPAPARAGSVEFIARAPEPIRSAGARTPNDKPARRSVAGRKAAPAATKPKIDASKALSAKSKKATARTTPRTTAKKTTRKTTTDKATTKKATRKTPRRSAAKKQATGRSSKAKAATKASTKNTSAAKPARKTASAKAPVTRKRSSARTNGSTRSGQATRKSTSARTNGSTRSTGAAKSQAKGKTSAPHSKAKTTAPKRTPKKK